MLQQPWRIDLVMINNEDEMHCPYNKSSAETSNEGKSDNVNLILAGMTGTLNRH